MNLYRNVVLAIVAICAAVLLAAGFGLVNFWAAMAVATAFALAAGIETVLWVRACRHHEQVRVFIRKELNALPKEPPPTVFPRTWQPFVGRQAAGAKR